MDSFVYQSDTNRELTPTQCDLLERVEFASHSFGIHSGPKFNSIAELRDYVNYLVIVSDRASFETQLREEMMFPDDSCRSDRKDYDTLLRRLHDNSHPLLGLFCRYDRKWEQSVIYLFIDNIKDHAEYSNGVLTENNILAYVYVHEAMHAYYYSYNSIGYYRIPELEEAFAECGMLYFIRNSRGLPYNLYDEAEYDVKLKKTNPNTYHYGFGADLFSCSQREGLTEWMIDRYREISNWIPDSGYYRRYQVDDYIKKVRSGDFPPCYRLIVSILNYRFCKPYCIVYRPVLIPGSRPVFTGIGSCDSIIFETGKVGMLSNGAEMKLLFETKRLVAMVCGLLHFYPGLEYEHDGVVRFAYPGIKVDYHVYPMGEWTMISLLELLGQINANATRYFLHYNEIDGIYQLWGFKNDKSFEWIRASDYKEYMMGNRYRPLYSDGKWSIMEKDSKSIILKDADELIYESKMDVFEFRYGSMWGVSYLTHRKKHLLTEYDCVQNRFGKVKVRKNGKWGLYDYIPCEYEDITEFDNHLYKVQKDGKKGIFERIPCEYDDILKSASCMYFIKNGQKFGIYSLCDCEYDTIEEVNRDILKVMNDGKWGMICFMRQSCGNYPQYECFNPNIIHYSYRYGGYHEHDYYCLIPCEYEDIEYFDGFFKIKMNGKWGVLDRVPCEYDDVEYFGQRLFKVKKDGLYGFHGKIPCKYEDVCFRFDDYTVKIGGRWSIYKEGK